MAEELVKVKSLDGEVVEFKQEVANKMAYF